MPTPEPNSHDGSQASGSVRTTAQKLTMSELDLPSSSNGPLALEGAGLGTPSTNPLHQVKTKLTVRVGTVELTVGELMSAQEQQVLRLDQTLDSPVEILLEGQVIARGELVAVDEHFGVRITQLPQPLKP